MLVGRHRDIWNRGGICHRGYQDFSSWLARQRDSLEWVRRQPIARGERLGNLARHDSIRGHSTQEMALTLYRGQQRVGSRAAKGWQ
jgi:hypothetical protein